MVQGLRLVCSIASELSTALLEIPIPHNSDPSDSQMKAVKILVDATYCCVDTVLRVVADSTASREMKIRVKELTPTNVCLYVYMTALL